jgi:cyclopropane fatty-acyl-phospholipid synthase-like methyltransferase
MTLEQLVQKLRDTFDPGGNLPDDCAEWAREHVATLDELDAVRRSLSPHERGWFEIIDTAMDALESDADQEQRREAWELLRNMRETMFKESALSPAVGASPEPQE